MSNGRSESTRTKNQGGQQGVFWAVLVGETEAENVRSSWERDAMALEEQLAPTEG